MDNMFLWDFFLLRSKMCSSTVQTVTCLHLVCVFNCLITNGFEMSRWCKCTAIIILKTLSGKLTKSQHAISHCVSFE